MKKKATFSREQLSKSKTFGYGKDLVLAVLEDRDYTKDEAEKEIAAGSAVRIRRENGAERRYIAAGESRVFLTHRAVGLRRDETV